jgi:hypothetical protein
MKHIHLGLLATALAVCIAPALAQTGSAPPTETQMRDNADTVGRQAEGMDGVTRRQHQYFRSLDRNQKGYLSNDDVSGDPFISKNYLKCDVDHDGKLTWEEFRACTHMNPPPDQR